MLSYDDQIKFLCKHNAHQITHSRSTLLTHLEGTYSLLREWGNDEDTCVAGLFHSVYGTLNFPSAIVKDRNKLRVVIDEKAEHLVWLHSIIDANEVEIDEDTTRRLIEIQVADLVDQDSRWNHYRQQHRWIRNLESCDMSVGARLAYESLSL